MKKWRYGLLVFGLLFLLAGCGGETEEPVETDETTEQKVVEPVETDTGARSFAEWSEFEIFAKVPALIADHSRIEAAYDTGGENYTIEITNTNKDMYKNYMKLLEDNKFGKYVENELDGSVYTSTFTKDNLVVTVNYIEHYNRIFVSASESQKLSPRLIYRDSYVTGNSPGAKTTFSMMEISTQGLGCVIQLKNGHFIVVDGGFKDDLDNLIGYLKSLAPAGQKPVIEGWFITHAHLDHVECLLNITKKLDYANQIAVEAFYFSQPSDATANINGDTSNVKSLLMACKVFKDSAGKKTAIYRPHMGQRYYFNDITIDVSFSQEIFPLGDSKYKNFNDTSTWLKCNIEGQDLLITGDADVTSQSAAIEIYSPEYLTLDVLMVPHHGMNGYSMLSRKMSVKTLLYPVDSANSDVWRTEIKQGNEELKAVVAEYYAYGDGTKVLTFPYQVGTAKSLPTVFR